MKRILFFLFCFFATFAAAQTPDPFALRHSLFGNFEHPTDVKKYVFAVNELAVFSNGYVITDVEFRNVFHPADKDTSSRAKKEYLDKLILMKQKVFLGMEMGVDTMGNFLKEVEGYRRAIEKPWIDKGYTREEAETMPSAKCLLMEYYSGIVMFEVMDREVWSKAVKDTAGSRAFFNNHRALYGTQTYASAR